MSTLSELFTGVNKKPFKPLPVEDPYTAQYLQGIEASGLGANKRINDTFNRNTGTNTGRLFSQGWGNSSLAGSYSLGNEDRRQQALLDLDNQLFSQRLQAREAGTSNALQQFGINTGAKQNFQNAQQQKAMANQQLFGDLLGAGMKAATAAPTGGVSLLGGAFGQKPGNPYAGLTSTNFMGY